MEPRIHTITLGVKDLKKSTRFYRDGLGLPQFQGPPPEEVTFFQLKGAWLALFPRGDLAKDANVPAEKTGFPGFSIGHIVGSPKEVDRMLEKAASLGAVITQPGKKQPWGGYSGYFKDLDGYLWEIVWMEKPFPIE